ncbi:hypothetical protein [Pedobacter miscanthi]|nr:hypothetical protein [Pedobacter miscanthi]
MEHFINPSLEVLDESWPNHGDVYIISDDKSDRILNCKKLYRFEYSLSWINLLHKGITKFQKDFPDIEATYLILDDLIPLKPVDELTIEKNESIFKHRKWNFLYYPHYKNGFNYNISINGQQFVQTPQEWPFYSQIGAGLLRLDYLLRLCEYAIDQNLHSPWEFEFIKSNEIHYISSYQWPTVRDGYSKQRYINFKAITFLNNGTFKNLLILYYLKQMPSRVFVFFIQKKNNIKHRLKGS